MNDLPCPHEHEQQLCTNCGKTYVYRFSTVHNNNSSGWCGEWEPRPLPEITDAMRAELSKGPLSDVSIAAQNVTALAQKASAMLNQIQGGWLWAFLVAPSLSAPPSKSSEPTNQTE